jgi:DNA processing protein
MEIRKLKKEEFPEALLEIPQPPKALYMRGEMPEGSLIYLCVVGSRKFTSYGKDACEKLIAGLKGYPIVIVSGLAMGIDTIAHRSALKNNLLTIAFPGSGLEDRALHPSVNVALADEIVEAGGALISEFEPGFKAQSWSFPMRNRLMAGISKAVLVIEAEEKSGTLITARLATEYNRDVLTVPGSINSQNSKGTNRLIRQGATPITSSGDLLEALGFEIAKDEDKQAKLFADCSPEEKKILDLIREPATRDELIRQMGMPTPAANAILSIMEIKGLIKESLGEIRQNI